MAGRIRDDDVVSVRERARIDEVVREYVSLKSAGGGSMKGLCPFHDERSPSFHVTPAKGFYHCFGCQEGGDVITFVQKIEHLSFTEAVEKLAGKFGVHLRYEEGGAAVTKPQGQRTRIVDANRAAAAYFTAQLASAEAETGRKFLLERGFEAADAEHFGVGYAPKGWGGVRDHLRARGFSDSELLTAGLLAQGTSGAYDRFRGRLIWPIRDLSGDVVGFGARKLYDDDEGPKYLNTPETPAYKKSQVLYGIDLARKDIAKSQRAVIVEGYTDVMACHLAGVPVAIATCGTAFGTEHIRVLRRLLMDQNEFQGEVVFTFDGDVAGQKAALRAFGEDQRFVSQTFVAVEPGGLDPCELRQTKGDQAVRDLVSRPVPLFEFAVRASLATHDLETAEGRIAGLREAAPVVARIRDESLRPEYARLLAGWLGVETDVVREAVSNAARANRQRPIAPTPSAGRPGASDPVTDQLDATAGPAAPGFIRPDPAEPRLRIEREALKCVLQVPELVGEWFDAVEDSAFSHPGYLAVRIAAASAGGPVAGIRDREWVDAVLAACPDDQVRQLVTELTVEPIPTTAAPDERYARSYLARLLERDVNRRIGDLKSRLQRIDSVAEPEASAKAFADLLALEQYRRNVRDQALGDA